LRLFTYGARTEEGVKKVLAKARKNAHSVEYQALIKESANLPTNLAPYRGYTILNAASEVEEVQVSVYHGFFRLTTPLFV
jgi:hypothetical protein